MWRGRKDGWESPPEEVKGMPTGLSGPARDPHLGDEAAWIEGDPLAGQLQGGSGIVAAALAGLVAAALGVAIWVLLSWQTGAIFSLMALGIGYLVGFAVRWAGRSGKRSFGILAAGITLVAGLIGMLLSVAVIIAENEGVPIRQVLDTLDAGSTLQVLGQAASPVGFVLLLFGVYESYRRAVISPRAPPTKEREDQQEGQETPWK